MDLKNQLDLIISYLERLNEVNGNPIESTKYLEQKENLEDLASVLDEFGKNSIALQSTELFDTQDTQEKLMLVHKYLSDLAWHISEIHDLNVEMIKLRIEDQN